MANKKNKETEVKQEIQLKPIAFPFMEGRCPWPVTQRFGEKITSKSHAGIDFACYEGTPVCAAAVGIVLYSGYDEGGYGWHVVLTHEDGSGTVYAHLKEQGAPAGFCAFKGAILGYSGNTGNSTGPHLHFEYRKDATKPKTVVDPDLYFEQPAAEPTKEESSKEGLHQGSAEVCCDVCNYRSENGAILGQFRRGQALQLTGKKKEMYGLVYYEATRPETIWVAGSDGFTQILLNA